MQQPRHNYGRALPAAHPLTSLQMMHLSTIANIKLHNATRSKTPDLRRLLGSLIVLDMIEISQQTSKPTQLRCLSTPRAQCTRSAANPILNSSTIEPEIYDVPELEIPEVDDETSSEEWSSDDDDDGPAFDDEADDEHALARVVSRPPTSTTGAKMEAQHVRYYPQSISEAIMTPKREASQMVVASVVEIVDFD